MQSRVPVEDLDVVIGMMRGILLNLFFLYAIGAILAGLWWWSRPKCSLCSKRVRIGKGNYHFDAEHKKVWLHSTCEELSTVTQRVTKDVVSTTGA